MSLQTKPPIQPTSLRIIPTPIQQTTQQTKQILLVTPLRTRQPTPQPTTLLSYRQTQHTCAMKGANSVTSTKLALLVKQALTSKMGIAK